jgi:hypothetical protein
MLKKRMVDKRLSDWLVARLKLFEEWPVGGCVTVLVPRDVVCVWTINELQ